MLRRVPVACAGESELVVERIVGALICGGLAPDAMQVLDLGHQLSSCARQQYLIWYRRSRVADETARLTGSGRAGDSFGTRPERPALPAAAEQIAQVDLAAWQQRRGQHVAIFGSQFDDARQLAFR